MKVLVCGGREFDDYNFLYDTLTDIHEQRRFTHLIHGGARGADRMSGEWASEKGLEVTVFHADWDKYGNRAGPLRNLQMLTEGKPDLVVAFPGGKGTAHMKDIARKADIEVIEIY